MNVDETKKETQDVAKIAFKRLKSETEEAEKMLQRLLSLLACDNIAPELKPDFFIAGTDLIERLKMIWRLHSGDYLDALHKYEEAQEECARETLKLRTQAKDSTPENSENAEK